MNNKVEILTESILAKGLSSSEIDQLAGVAELKDYKKGDFIVQEDEMSRDIYVVCEGQVSIEVQHHRGDGSIFRLQVMRTKSIFGEFAFLDGARRSADVKAASEVKLLLLPYAKLLELMEKNTSIGYAMMRNIAELLAERVRNANFDLRNHY